MRVKFYYDFNCPYCYIAYIRLKKAISEVDFDVRLKLEPCEIEPALNVGYNKPAVSRLMEKYELTRSEAENKIAEINKLGRDEGLDFHYENTLITSSKNAHKMIKASRDRNNEKNMHLLMEKIFNAYYCENRKISDIDLLIELADSLGMSKKSINARFRNINTLYLEDDEIYSLPYCILNDDIGVKGLHTKDEYKEILKNSSNEYGEGKCCVIGNDRINIECYYDFTCEYSYISNERIKKAIDELNLDIEREIMPFELCPKCKKTNNETILDLLNRQNDNNETAVSKIIEDMENMASDEGLKINYPNSIITNTRDAHRLIYYAKYHYGNNTANRIADDLFRAEFVDSKRISDKKVLIKIAESNGLNSIEVEKMLKSKRYNTEITYDATSSQEYGVDRSPTVIIKKDDKSIMIPYLCEKEDYKDYIHDIIEYD